MTKREKFVAIVAVLEGIENVNPELIDAMKHEIELLDNKKASPRKPTKVQVENEGFKADILEFLAEADAPMSIKDIQVGVESLQGLSNQRMTHLLTPLVKAEVIDRVLIKKVPHFSLR